MTDTGAGTMAYDVAVDHSTLKAEERGRAGVRYSVELTGPMDDRWAQSFQLVRTPHHRWARRGHLSSGEARVPRQPGQPPRLHRGIRLERPGPANAVGPTERALADGKNITPASRSARPTAKSQPFFAGADTAETRSRKHEGYLSPPPTESGCRRGVDKHNWEAAFSNVVHAKLALRSVNPPRLFPLSQRYLVTF